MGQDTHTPSIVQVHSCIAMRGVEYGMPGIYACFLVFPGELMEKVGILINGYEKFETSGAASKF